MPDDFLYQFKTSSGLPDDIDVTFTDVRWEFDPGYNNGETLVLKTQLVIDDDDFEDREQFFPAGTGWTTEDRGKTAVREDGKAKSFNTNSYVGTLIDSMVEVGEADVIAHAKAIGAGPVSAEFWEGLKGHVKNQDHDFGGDIGTKQRWHFTEIMGWAEEAKKATGAAKKAAGVTKKAAAARGKAAAPAAEPEAASAGGGLTDEIRATLDKIADDAANYDAFVETAIADVPEATSDADVKAALMSTEPGSIWDDACERYIAANPS